MNPKFDRQIKTEKLTDKDAEILSPHTRQHGESRPRTAEELNAIGFRRVSAVRDIDTGEWKTEPLSKTQDGDSLPFFVIGAGR